MNVAEIISNKLIEAMAKDQIPCWRKPWKSIAPANAVSGKAYRGINFIMLSLAERGSDFVTFNQAKEAGGYVKQGAKGEQVVFYKMLNGENEQGEERHFPLLRYYYVFPLSDIDGADKLKAKIAERRKTIAFEPLAECERLINAAGITTTHGGDRAYYSPAIHAIKLPERNNFQSVAHYYATSFHEIGHALARDTGTKLDGSFGSEPYSKEELVAEMFANFCLSHVGLDSGTLLDNSVAYLGSWLNRLQKDPKLIIGAASQAQKRFDLLMQLASPVVSEQAA